MTRFQTPRTRPNDFRHRRVVSRRVLVPLPPAAAATDLFRFNFFYMSDIDAPQNKKRKVTPMPEDKSELAPVSGLLIKRHSEKARLPTRGSALSAGYDLYRCVRSAGCDTQINSCAFSAETKVIPARGKALIDTQISVAVPVGTYGRVAPRSGLGALPCPLQTI